MKRLFQKRSLMGALLGTIALSASGCFLGIISTADYMQRWVGQDENHLVSRSGAPDRTANLPNGGKVFTWVKEYNVADDGAPPEMKKCNRSFTLSSAGTIVDWSTDGCPSHIIDDKKTP